MLEFLIRRFYNGAKYGTLNSDKAAIVLVASGNFSDDKVISRFMRGVFKSRPTRPKYSTTWNADQGFCYIKNLSATGELKIRDLAEKQ